MKNKDWFLVFLLGIFWGTSFLFVEILLEYITPFVIVYLRVAIASVLLLIYILIRNNNFQFSKGDLFNLFVMGLLTILSALHSQQKKKTANAYSVSEKTQEKRNMSYDLHHQ